MGCKGVFITRTCLHDVDYSFIIKCCLDNINKEAERPSLRKELGFNDRARVLVKNQKLPWRLNIAI